MKKLTKISISSLIAILVLSGSLFAGGFDIGADIYNRYVWRGTDFGNTPAIQPSLSYSAGDFEIGAWGSWSVTGAQDGNENDLYATYSLGGLSLTVTDYFFPDYSDDQYFEYGENGSHTIEASAGYSIKDFSIMAAMNVLGNDDDNSKYVELSYGFYEKEDISSSFFIGAGDGMYSTDGEFAAVNVGMSVSKGKYSASYIVNPDQETSFLTFGISL